MSKGELGKEQCQKLKLEQYTGVRSWKASDEGSPYSL